MQNNALEFERRCLSLITPSYDPRYNVTYYPASVKLKNGSRLEKVIFVDRISARKTICSLDWLESHGTRLWDQVISIYPSSICEVSSSKDRLDPRLVSEIHRLHGDRKYYLLLITKDDCPVHLSTNTKDMGLGAFDFPVLSCNHEAHDIDRVVGYNISKKTLAQQIKEDERRKGLPLTLLKQISSGRRPEKEARPPEPWEVCYCIYPSISEGCDRDQRILDKYGGSALKRDDVNSYNYHHLQESMNSRINEERERRLISSSLIYKNDSFFDQARQGECKPSAYEPKNIDDKLLQGLNNADRGRYLVKVALKDGTMVDNVVLIHENVMSVDDWKSPPYMSYGRSKYLIDADDIQIIEPSSNSIPIEFRNKLPLESGMGRLNFRVTMNDGSMHAYAYPGYSDFIDVPSPYSTRDIKSLEAWDRLVYWAFAYFEEPIFATCVFKNEGHSPGSAGDLQALRDVFKRKR